MLGPRPKYLVAPTSREPKCRKPNHVKERGEGLINLNNSSFSEQVTTDLVSINNFSPSVARVNKRRPNLTHFYLKSATSGQMPAPGDPASPRYFKRRQLENNVAIATPTPATKYLYPN